MAHRWYVVHVYSGFERKVCDSIKEQAIQKGLDDEIEEVLVPMEEVVDTIINDVAAYTVDEEQDDGITLVAVRVS